MPLRRAGARQAYQVTLRHAGWDGLLVDARTPAGELRELRIGLLGGHQADNAAVVLALLDALHERHGVTADEAALRAGLGDARWPGRLELIDGARLGIGRVLLDGAHNPAGAAALAAALRELGVRRPVMVFGAMRGKRVDAILRALAPLQPRPVFTAVDEATALLPAELARRWERAGAGASRSAATPRTALEIAASLRRPDEPILVAGSLYLVGAVRALLKGEADAG